VQLLGLTPSQDAVYRSLLAWPGSSPERLSSLTGLPAHDVADAVQVLAERGLAKDLVPVRPDVCLEPVLARAEQELGETRLSLTAARRDLTDLVELYAGGVARSERVLEVEHLRGRDEVQRRIDELCDTAERELLACYGGTAPTGGKPDEDERADVRSMRARGMRLRTIVPPGVYDAPVALAHAEALVELGDEHRVHPAPPVTMLLLDRRVAVVPVDPAASAEGALLLWSATLVHNLLRVFDLLWEQARPLALPEETVPLPERERRLLELLAAGVKDEAIARHLDVSVRTVRRESAALMARLGAGTRFQAGAEAVRRGWL
jgi:DNA-binding CsgD family transcriptional regulator